MSGQTPVQACSSMPGGGVKDNPCKDVGIIPIFFSFLKMGAVLIGGGYGLLALLEREIVEKRKWASSAEMADYYALSQLLPGIIAVNTCMLVGNRLRGWSGLLAATAGLLFVPFFLILAYAALYSSVSSSHFMQSVLDGVRPAAAGMILGMGVLMVARAAKNFLSLTVAVCACAMMILFDPPVVLMLLSGIAVGFVWNFAVFSKRRFGKPGTEGVSR